MADNFGIIYDKIEIRVLILFVMSRLTEPVTIDVLTELTMCDESISYFDVTECISTLVKTKHLLFADDKYSLTAKGRRNGDILEKDLPYSVRAKAEDAASFIREAQKRNSMIKTSISDGDNDGFKVSFSLSDGIGDIISMDLYTASAQQAEKMKKNFRKNAEKIYREIIEIMTR
ncbi:MAG: DUF4364 family protein [Oscillospiraceae bacterium]|nr:DUF4364 family protein [Oscillospiraceae bacterium]